MQFRDLKKQYNTYHNEIDQAIHQVIEKTEFISGSAVKTLEKRLAEYVGVKHCVTCANGTDALFLVLKAWNIGPGDAVFVPDFTFFATAEVVSQVGATPVFVDVFEDTYNINPVHLEQMIIKTLSEQRLTPKAVIPVDLFGLLADYEAIKAIADRYTIKVLEDAAQGFGASYQGKMACSYGDAATTSFFPAKPLGCYGDGGAIFTNDDAFAHLLESLRVHGKGEDKYDNVRIGQNSRLDTIQAAILNVKLTAFINHELQDVNQVYLWYNELLKNHVVVPFIPEGHQSCFAQYSIQLQSEEERNGLKTFLNSHGIPTMIYYTKTMHQQIAYRSLNIEDHDYPISTKLCKTILQIPIHPYLTKEDVKHVSEHIITFVTKKRG